jgi:hypothetical protein
LGMEQIWGGRVILESEIFVESECSMCLSSHVNQPFKGPFG